MLHKYPRGHQHMRPPDQCHSFLDPTTGDVDGFPNPFPLIITVLMEEKVIGDCFLCGGTVSFLDQNGKVFYCRGEQPTLGHGRSIEMN